VANTIDVKVPDIGDYKDVPIIEVLVKPGDVVKTDQSLVTLESDKATMDVPAPGAGTVREVVAKVGDKVAMGSLILRLEEAAGAAPSAAPAPPAASPPAAAVAIPAPPTAAKVAGPANADFSGVFAGPAVRRLARELDLDLTHVRGTGEKGRITREDVKAALSGGGVSGGPARPEIPAVDFSKFGPVETKPLSRIKRISGPRLHASWLNAPQVTHSDEADVTDLDVFRKSLDDEAKADKKAP
jgi:pyruvate dehydrogenase E2 component (dihydrolipoamide acetyltransferase)